MNCNPYKGLMPYTEKDVPFFFGREREWEIIADNLLATRLTLLYGASGIGKSSLLRAGVAYHLMRDAKKNLAEYGTPKFAVVVFNSWQDDPLEGLVKQVEKDIKSLLNGKTFEPFPSSLNLDQILEKCADRLDEKEGEGKLLIILDQFEEYFLYHPDENGSGTFADEFPRAVNRLDLPVNFLISIRDDSLAKLDHFKTSIPNLFNNYLRVKHLDAKSAYDAISKPIEVYNALRSSEQPISIQEDLINAVINQVSQLGRGANQLVGRLEKPIRASYLQLVMTHLWEEEMNSGSSCLRLQTLIEQGGIEKFLEDYYAKWMERLSENEQNASALIFNYLVTPSGNIITYSLGDLALVTNLPEKQLSLLLNKLTTWNILVRTESADGLEYKIVDDFMAVLVFEWLKKKRRQQKIQTNFISNRLAKLKKYPFKYSSQVREVLNILEDLETSVPGSEDFFQLAEKLFALINKNLSKHSANLLEITEELPGENSLE